MYPLAGVSRPRPRPPLTCVLCLDVPGRASHGAHSGRVAFCSGSFPGIRGFRDLSAVAVSARHSFVFNQIERVCNFGKIHIQFALFPCSCSVHMFSGVRHISAAVTSHNSSRAPETVPVSSNSHTFCLCAGESGTSCSHAGCGGLFPLA